MDTDELKRTSCYSEILDVLNRHGFIPNTLSSDLDLRGGYMSIQLQNIDNSHSYLQSFNVMPADVRVTHAVKGKAFFKSHLLTPLGTITH